VACLGAVMMTGAIAGAFPGITAAGASTANRVVNGGALVDEVSGTWLSLDPDSAKGITIPFPVFDTLFYQNGNNTITPDLALTHKFVNGGLGLAITLRKGVVFQDGTPWNATAAAFNITRSIGPGTDCDGYVNGGISGVTVTGTYSLTINMTRRVASLPVVLANQFCGYMMSPQSVSTYGASVSQHPVGTGSFSYTGGVTGNTAILTRNSSYWGKAAHLATLTIEAVPVEATAYANLQSGQANIWTTADGIFYGPQVKSSGLTLLKLPAGHNNYFQISTKTGPLSNPLARKAIMESINVKTIDKNILNNEVSYVVGPIPPGMLGYSKNVPKAAVYNISDAQKLVNEIGGLTITLGYTPGSALVTAEVTVEQQMMQAAGIKVTLVPLTSTVFLQQELSDSYETLMTSGGVANPDPDLLFPTRFLSTAPDNEFGLNDPTVDKLILQGEASYSHSARQQIYQKLNAYIASKVFCQVEVGALPTFFILTKNVHNFDANQYGWLNWNQVWLG
jgi:peptide/nickel transport system substrate-binding protein